jgi:hypothetical protein
MVAEHSCEQIGEPSVAHVRHGITGVQGEPSAQHSEITVYTT